MLPPTKEILEEISRANFHQDFGVAIPERISLIQLYRWLVFGFTPLPRNIELQLAHLPIFDSDIRRFITKISVRDKLVVKIKQLLMDGILLAKGRIEDEELTIPVEYWHLPLQNIRWERSAAEVDMFNIKLFSNSNEERHIDANHRVSEYKEKYGTVAYTEVNVASEDVVRIFDGLKITDDHVLNLKEQVAARLRKKSKAGAKPRHDWKAYEGKFNELMAYYGAIGIDEPEWKNQAAVEKKLLEWGYNKFGEAPSESTIRRYVSKWIKNPSD